MTVNELIEQLKRYPADAPVVVHGYENGYDLVTDILPKSIETETSITWYNGQCTDAEDGTPAVLICSERRWRTKDE